MDSDSFLLPLTQEEEETEGITTWFNRLLGDYEPGSGERLAAGKESR